MEKGEIGIGWRESDDREGEREREDVCVALLRSFLGMNEVQDCASAFHLE